MATLRQKVHGKEKKKSPALMMNHLNKDLTRKKEGEKRANSSKAKEHQKKKKYCHRAYENSSQKIKKT